MSKRMLVALGMLLMSVGPACAQGPVPGPVMPPVETAMPMMPANTWWPMGNAQIGRGRRLWVSTDYLLAWVAGSDLPALVTTSPAGTARTSAGVLGQPNTNILFGGRVNDNTRSGFKIGAGYWFDAERIWGVEAGFMVLESQATLFSASSQGGPAIIGQPFTNALTSSPQAVLVAFPGSSNGSIAARASSGNFYMGNFDFTENVLDNSWVRVNALLGYRFYRYDESLRMAQTVLPTSPDFAAGTQIATTDNFGTQNEFHGLDLGVRTRFYLPNNISLGLLATAAIGNIHRTVNIAGNQVVTVPGVAPVTRNGGVYALSSNIGTHAYNDWSILPQLGAEVAWQVNPNLRLHVGYSALLLNHIARAGNQVDTTINPNLLPPATATPTATDHPAFSQNESDFWIQAVNFGVEFVY